MTDCWQWGNICHRLQEATHNIWEPTYASKDTTITAAQPTTAPVTESGTVYSSSPINPAEHSSDTKPNSLKSWWNSANKMEYLQTKTKTKCQLWKSILFQDGEWTKGQHAKVSWKKAQLQAQCFPRLQKILKTTQILVEAQRHGCAGYLGNN